MQHILWDGPMTVRDIMQREWKRERRELEWKNVARMSSHFVSGEETQSSAVPRNLILKLGPLGVTCMSRVLGRDTKKVGRKESMVSNKYNTWDSGCKKYPSVEDGPELGVKRICTWDSYEGTKVYKHFFLLAILHIHSSSVHRPNVVTRYSTHSTL